MGCNAWNHRPSCNCGWGGDTGGGAGRTIFADGRAWQRTRSPTYETYTIPNARCPVCGAAVFFYQSPYGGRVFFDELGPPWAKHPCTDRGFHAALAGPASSPIRRPPAWEQEGWRPLTRLTVTRQEGFTFATGYTTKPSLRRHQFGFQFLGDFSGDSPILCRPLKDASGRFEISTLREAAAASDTSPITFVVCPEATSAEHMKIWEQALSGDVEGENLVGMLLSFALRASKSPFSRFPEHCDWDSAKGWFRKAADRGHWAALNNLGVMHLGGYGIEKDERAGFEHLMAASNELNPTTLEHLAQCYETGLGTSTDAEMATFLKELAKALRVEEASEDGDN